MFYKLYKNDKKNAKLKKAIICGTNEVCAKYFVMLVS